jgi:predicted nucleic acid-binding protein
VAVMLTSRDRASRTELTLTENISSRGARVVTKKRWSANDSLVIKSLEGDLQSEARVIYSQPIRENVYAIGVELIAPMGDWRTEKGRGY